MELWTTKRMQRVWYPQKKTDCSPGGATVDTGESDSPVGAVDGNASEIVNESDDMGKFVQPLNEYGNTSRRCVITPQILSCSLNLLLP